MSFFGPKTHSGPNEYRFWTKKSLGKIFGTPGTTDRKIFRTPRTPDRKKILDPARAGPAGPTGSPKVVQIVPLGYLTLLKRSGALKNNGFEYKYYVEIFCLAKVMPKTRFLASVWGFLACFGGRLAPWLCSTPQNRQKRPKIENVIKNFLTRVLTQFFSGFSSILKGLV